MAASSTDYTLCRLQPGHVHLPMLRQIYQGNVRLALAEEAVQMEQRVRSLLQENAA